MSLKIIYDKENPLLNRRRIAFEASHEKSATPKKEELKKEISKFVKIGENLISIRHVYSKFGMNKSKVITHIYDNEETFKKLESKKLKVKKDGKEEKKEQKA